MDELYQLDESIYGRFGGPREYGEMEGRFGGGGWISDPMAASDADGKGVWAPPVGRDGERNLTSPGFSGSSSPGTDPILSAVERSAGPFDGDGWY